MRDAFGGTFMIQILLVFIVIYVGFIGIAINYGRAFRVKNYVIDYLEENQINNLSNASQISSMRTDISQILDNTGYSNTNICDAIGNGYDENDNTKCINGVVIKQNNTVTKNGVNYVYYTVNTYIGYNLGFLNSLLSLTSSNDRSVIAGYFRISGETKVIVTN